jgi:hypothetical protein
MHAAQPLPPLIPLSAPLICGGLVYYAGSTWAQMAGDALHATQYGAVPACVFAVILYPFMIVLHDQTVQKIADRDKAAFLAARKPEAAAQPVRVQAEPQTAMFFQQADTTGLHGVIGFANATDEQTRELARRVVGGNYNLAYNQLRLIGNWSDRSIGLFRQELKDRGFAVQQGKNEVVMTGAGKKHFYKIARQILPHSSRAAQK